MQMKIGIFAFFLIVFGTVQGQDFLKSGPMPGYSDHREVSLWVQTQKPCKVQVRFWPEDNPKSVRFSITIKTSQDHANAASLVLDSLTPGKRYAYDLLLDGKKHKRDSPFSFQTLPLWQFRTDPPSMRFAVGSCTYVPEELWDRPGKPYGDSMLIFKTIADKKPDFMLWIGDNTYTREGDWNTWGGFMHRYSHTRSIPELQPLLQNTHHYATWDDHEYGPNDADRSFWNKELASKAFSTFWPMPPGAPLGEGPVTRTFSWGDCQFFMLDDRWFRAPNGDKDSTKAYLGSKQIDWLIDALTFSKATFKIIACGGQVINNARVYENYAAYPVERRLLIDRITAAKISGVLFLSGDRHHAELSRLERPGTYPLHDLTTSPLTAGIHNPGNEPNTLRVDGTLFNGHNFAWMEVTGPQKDRILKIQIVDNRGRMVWEKEMKATDLR
jgi:alkaline phosphatase D